jgi:subtilisin family serine protease
MWNATLVPAVPVLDELGPEWAWAGATGAGVRIAIIDSGVDAAHPAVGGPLDGYVAISETASGIEFTSASPGRVVDVFARVVTASPRRTSARWWQGS